MVAARRVGNASTGSYATQVSAHVCRSAMRRTVVLMAVAGIAANASRDGTANTALVRRASASPPVRELNVVTTAVVASAALAVKASNVLPAGSALRSLTAYRKSNWSALMTNSTG